MKIVADENIPFIHDVFDGLGQVETFAGRSISALQVKDADVLLVRSVTQVNERLLDGSSIKFVGTCTIGTDHIDMEYLKQQGIGFSAAPGCNADAVVDYVISTLAILSQGHNNKPEFDLFSRCVGIVGVGNVGRRLRERLQAMGIRCICADPLHDDQEIQGLVHFEQLLAEADIVSLHVPLTTTGEHPTHHLLSATSLAKLKPNTVLINTARGPVIDNHSLKNVLVERPDLTAVLDVWEYEPEIDVDLLNNVALATPHIAGYSLDGKIRGTKMIYQALCRYFDFPETIDVMALAPLAVPILLSKSEKLDTNKTAFDTVLNCYDVRRDDRNFRQVMTVENDKRAESFDGLRKNYPVRREFGVTEVRCRENNEVALLLNALSFKL